MNDILITRIGTLCESKIITWDYDFSIYVSLALIGDVKILPEFLNQYIKTNYYKKEYIKRSLLLAVPQKINLKDLKETTVKYPSLKEQKKIADFLQAIDKKIELMERKVTLFNNIKKDYFNKIFTENNKLGIKYEHVKLNELIKQSKAGGTPKSTIKEYYEGNIPFLSINDMTSQGKYIQSTEKHISEQGLNNSSAWLVPKNSLLYSMYASVGFVSINNIELTTSQAIYSIILKDSLSLDYVYYYLSYYKKYVNRYIETGTQGNLNANIVKNLPILLPSIKNQEKIGSLFSYIDSKITLLMQEVKLNKEIKQSLLSKMFC